MKLITPDEIEARWLAAEKKTVTYLARGNFSMFAGAVFTILLAYACFHFSALWSLKFRSMGHIEVFRFTSAFFPFLILAGLIPLVVGRPPWIVSALLAVVIWSAGLMARKFGVSSSPVLFISMPFLMLCAYGLWAARRNGMRKGLTVFIWALVFLAVSFLIGWSPGLSPTAGMGTKVFWRMLPQYYFFFVFSHLVSEDAARDSESLIWSPSHFVFPLVFPVGTSPVPAGESLEAQELWWDGFLRLTRGLLLAVPAILLDDMIITAQVQGWPDVLWRHLFLLLVTITVGNVAVGLARMYGINAPPGTFFVFLARSPIDFWKRDSTYAYHFALRFIFFPAARLLKNAAAAMVVSFAVFYIYRQLVVEYFVKGFYELLVPGLDTQILSAHFEGDYLLWLGWFVMIIIGAKFWFSPRFIRKGPLHAWAPVILTQAAMLLPQLVFLFY